ncbi:MAG: hypothetical protein ACYDC2_03335 [Solirubrobacteraceae bacterium]
MARIIVTTDQPGRSPAQTLDTDASVMLDERVDSVHLCDDHASAQLMERLAWAVTDAEAAQHDHAAA